MEMRASIVGRVIQSYSPAGANSKGTGNSRLVAPIILV